MKFFYSVKKLKQKKDASPRELLLEDILKTQLALETAYSGFDNATDPDLIDCYIYEVNSALKRYRFLLNQAHHMQLFLEEPSGPLLTNPMPGSLSSQNCS